MASRLAFEVVEQGRPGHRSVKWVGPHGVHHAVTFEPHRGSLTHYESDRGGTHDRYGMRHDYSPYAPLPPALVKRIGPSGVARLRAAYARPNPTPARGPGYGVTEHRTTGGRTVSWRDPYGGVRYDVTFEPKHGQVLLYERTMLGRDRFAKYYDMARDGQLPKDLLERLGPENARAMARLLKEGPRRNPTTAPRFRITMPGDYVLDTPGHKDPGSRRGFYSTAKTPADAAREIYKRLHLISAAHLDVQPWDDKASRSGTDVQCFAVSPRKIERIRNNPSDLDVRERWDRCVRAVTARGGVRSPAGICAASMRKAYGPQFQRIAAEGRSAAAAKRHARGEVLSRATGRPARRPAARLRPTAVQRRGQFKRVEREQRTAKRAVANPVQELLQSHVFGPGHAAVEWVDPGAGRWVKLGETGRRPPRSPGPHLVAPGAHLMMMWDGGVPALQYARGLFVRHGHHWKFLRATSAPVNARVAAGRVVVHGKLAPRDHAVLTQLARYAATEVGAHLRAGH